MLFKNSSVDLSDSERHAARFQFSMIVISMIVAGAVLAIVVAIGIQYHNDRLAQMIQSEVELQTTGARMVRSAPIGEHACL
jgi:hypothetical protein